MHYYIFYCLNNDRIKFEILIVTCISFPMSSSHDWNWWVTRSGCVSGHASTTCRSVCTAPHGHRRSSRGSRPRPRRFHRPDSTAREWPLTRSLVKHARSTSFTYCLFIYTSCTSQFGFNETYVMRRDDTDSCTDNFITSKASLISSTSL